jgi:hypothetical protein
MHLFPGQSLRDSSARDQKDQGSLDTYNTFRDVLLEDLPDNLSVLYVSVLACLYIIVQINWCTTLITHLSVTEIMRFVGLWTMTRC